MTVLKKISKWLDQICGVLIVLMLAALVIVVTLQIIWRTWFTSRSWTEEVTRYLLIWATYIGATCVYYHGGNIAITVLQNALPKPAGKFLRALVHAICLVLFIILAYYGFRYCSKLTKTATSIPLKMSTVYLCMPISMVIMGYHALVMMIEEIIAKPDKEVKA